MNITRREMVKMLGALMMISPASYLLSNQNSGNTRYYEIAQKAKTEGWIKLPINQLMEKIAFEFIDVPYIGGTLDISEQETCTVYLDKLDCVTYFETVIAIAFCFRAGKFDFESLVAQVQKTRYRDSIIENYTSRLHYTADWIYYNVKNKIIKDITKDLGGEKIKFNTYFMSANPDKYNALTKHPEFIPIIKAQEKEINSRDYYYIPKDKLEKNIPGIQSCDIIAITTSIGGLDYSHTGFAYKNEDDEIQFLHASSAKKEVTLDTYLSRYLSRINKDTGITVLRPQ